MLCYAKRVGPLDRWVLLSDEGRVYNSLTSVLEAVFKKTGNKHFVIDAELGLVFASQYINPDEQLQQFSMYGDK